MKVSEFLAALIGRLLPGLPVVEISEHQLSCYPDFKMIFISSRANPEIIGYFLLFLRISKSNQIRDGQEEECGIGLPHHAQQIRNVGSSHGIKHHLW